MTMTLDKKVVEDKLKQLDNVIDQSMPKIYQYFHDITPMKTGNAKGNTYRNGNTIYANYQYAAVLDAGRSHRDGQMRGSMQAPQGMTTPTIAFAQAEILKKIKSIGF